MGRQLAALAAKLSGHMKNKPTKPISKETRGKATQDKTLVRALNLGLDVHYRQVTVAMQEDGGRIKAAGKMSHGAFLCWARTKLEEGWWIDSCYEASIYSVAHLSQCYCALKRVTDFGV